MRIPLRMFPTRHTLDAACSKTVWWPIRVVLGLVVLILAWVVVTLLRREHVRQDPWLFIHVISMTAGFLLCYGIGILANCYSLQRSLDGVSIGKSILWRRLQIWMSLASILLVAIGLVAGAIWAKTALGRYWDWDPKEVAPLAVCGWQIAFVLLLRNAAARWLICSAIGVTILVTYAWFLSNWIAVGTIAAIQVPALVAGLGPSRVLGRLLDPWARYRARNNMRPFGE
jgi:ABC-type transport system involved in cytochrome c biogenesis permease subunit